MKPLELGAWLLHEAAGRRDYESAYRFGAKAYRLWHWPPSQVPTVSRMSMRYWRKGYADAAGH